MTEAQLFEAIRDLAKLRGWMLYHTYRSDRSEAGFPDLVLVHPRTGDLLFAELKSEKGRISQTQRAWLDALRASRVPVYVWRPVDLTNGVIAHWLTPSDVATAHVGRRW